MAKRILALIAAVAMVAGALAYRSSRQPDGDGGSGAGRSASGAIVCAEELGPVCDVLGGDVVIEPTAMTFSRLVLSRSAAEAGVAGWLVAGPWPAMVDDERSRSGSRPQMFGPNSRGLAAAPIVAVARKGQLPPPCAPEVTWKCLGDAAQQPAFRIGGDSARTPGGLFLRAAALSGFLGKSDFATNDLEEQPDARTWLENLNLRLLAAPGFGAGSLESFLLQQGSASVFVTGGAGVGAIGGNVSVEVKTPTPIATIAVTYTPTTQGGRSIDEKKVAGALGRAGWKVQPNAKTEGLPSPGVLLALRTS